MKIKTFPLQFIDIELQEIKEVAEQQNLSMKDFMKEAIKEKILKCKEQN